MTLSIFSPGQPGYYGLIALFMLGLVLLFVWGNAKRDKDSRFEMLQRKYLLMDAEKLAETPEEELVEAVVANLMGKLDKHHPDPYRLMPQQTHGRCVVYSVWLLCKELDAGSFEELAASPSWQFIELAADGFESIGAAGCAAALRGAMDTEDPEALAELHADFLESVEAEQPLTLCAQYIRDTPNDFIDTGLLGE